METALGIAEKEYKLSVTSSRGKFNFSSSSLCYFASVQEYNTSFPRILSGMINREALETSII